MARLLTLSRTSTIGICSRLYSIRMARAGHPSYTLGQPRRLGTRGVGPKDVPLNLYFGVPPRRSSARDDVSLILIIFLHTRRTLGLSSFSDGLHAHRI